MTFLNSILDVENKKRLVYLAFFCFSIAQILSGCDLNHRQAPLAIEGATMGTWYHIKVVDAGDMTAPTLQTLVDQRLVAINASMSTYIADSELSQLNQHALNEPVKISAELLEVLQLSQKVSADTNGAFDITVGPLVNLWGFGPDKTHSVPSDVDISSARAGIGYDKLQLLPAQHSVLKTADITIDLSASAKGFATDLLARDFRARGFHHFMIEIGGEIYAEGNNGKGDGWSIGVEKPALGHDGSMQKLLVSHVAVATSGDYRNYYEVDGKRISHTIDPSTGRPITHNLASVTVINEMGGSADAYATALNVLGPELGPKRAEELNLAAYFIIRSKDGYVVKYTPSFTQYMVP